MADDPLDPQGDPFGPPEVSIEVECLHCGEQYDSYRIEWRVTTDADGKQHGFWCCPTPGCGGMGFGFDILPTDPDYQDERGGWVWCDDEDSDEDDLDEDFLPEASNDSRKPSGNGHGPVKPPGGEDDQIPF